MTTELTYLGECPTCGYPRWLPAMCRCGHAVTVHRLVGRRGTRQPGAELVRKDCTVHGCECVKFEEEVEGGA